MYGRPIPIPRPVYGTRCLTASEAATVKANCALSVSKTLATISRGNWATVIAKAAGALLPDMSALSMLKDFVSVVADVVDKFFPAVKAKARVVGNMSATSNMSPAMFVRVVWINTHKGITYTNSDFQQLEIINIYLQYPDLDWRADKYITVQVNSLGGPVVP
jgi:hypothetical protein